MAENAKFCQECGFALHAVSTSEQRITEEKIEGHKELKASIFELGNRLEEMVERILQAEGYVTVRRQRLVGKSGNQFEIDVIGKKSDRIIAIECKNYKEPVGLDKLTHFATKLEELGFKGKGIFVSPSDFTSDAAQFAQFRNIQTWTYDEITEKWMAVSLGRVESRKGQSLTVEYALPLNVDFIQATKIDLQNKDKIEFGKTPELIYHPYFSIEYSFKTQVKDPTKKLHKLEDKDTLFIDALTGRVLNPMPEKGIGILAKALKAVAFARVRSENERTKKLLQELRSKKPLRTYDIDIKNDYTVSKLRPIIRPREADGIAIDFVIEKNTQMITYYPETDEESFFPETESISYTPRKTDIRIIRKEMVAIPRWSVEFDSLGTRYAREILACSGTVLEDTLSYCPRHFKLGAITIVSKKTVAVCEICGQSFCEDHVRRCPICSKWLCEEHGIDCDVCENRFCKEHISLTCPICDASICNSCAITCPICNVKYGKNHAVTCDKCRTLVCPNCVTTTGLIRKTRICKRCSGTN